MLPILSVSNTQGVHKTSHRLPGIASRTTAQLGHVGSGSQNEPATAGARCARGRSQWHRRSDQASGIG